MGRHSKPEQDENSNNTENNENSENIEHMSKSVDNGGSADNVNFSHTISSNETDKIDSKDTKPQNEISPHSESINPSEGNRNAVNSGIDENKEYSDGKDTEGSIVNTDNNGGNEDAIIVENTEGGESSRVINYGNNKLFLVISGLLLVVTLVVIGGFLVIQSNNSNGPLVPDPEDVKIDKVEKKNPQPVNTQVVDLGNDSIGLNIVDVIGDESRGAFVFSGDEGINEDTKIVDMYVTFSGQKSVDMLLSNFNLLEAAIADNKFALVIHPVVTTNEVSLMIPEALAQSFSSGDSDKTWEFFAHLLASARLNYASNYYPEDVKKSIVLSAEELGFNNITEESLDEEPFLEWIFSKEDIIPGKISEHVPAVYVDGNRLDHKEISFNNSNEFMTELLKDD